MLISIAFCALMWSVPQVESSQNFTCQSKLDLGFILDNSGSVGYHNFERMKNFVKDLTDFYKLGRDETRVAVMSFADSANIHIPFYWSYSYKYQFDNAVNRIQYTGGGTATARALDKAYNYMYRPNWGARSSGYKKVLVILTDGYSNTGQVWWPAQRLKNLGVVIFSVGIGSVSTYELQQMASDPASEHVITLSSFTQLSWLAQKMSTKTCNVSNFQVFCDSDYMTAVFDRNNLPRNINNKGLYLLDRSCNASSNSTHFIVKTPLTGCGTIFSKNEQTLFFTNVVSEGGYDNSSIITRDFFFKANITCAYPRNRTVGAFSFAPAKQKVVVVSKDGQGNFSLTMDVFPSGNYYRSYTSNDYPVFKSLSDFLYIQYSVNTSDANLVVRAETCRATPTNRPYDSPQYVFIDDGCSKDETIRYYTNRTSRVQRFSMQAFRFLSQHRFVYLHCDLVVCHAHDNNSICARSTTCRQRYRRDVGQGSEDVSGMYPLSFGPLMHGKESTEENSRGESKDVNTTLVGSLIGFGCLSLVLIGALLYMIKRSRRHRSDQTQSGENKNDLAVQNLGYT